MSEEALMNNYGHRSTMLVKGEGAHVIDSNGRRYLDAISGIAVCGLGYSHPAVTKALCEQASTLIHCSNLYLIEPQVRLGEKLCQIAGMDKVFFSNSGAEANEAALKMARKFGNDKGISEPEVITTNGSFHGRTMATLSATGNSKVHAGFYPLLSGYVHVDYNNIDAIIAAATDNTVAVMVEPIQGEGGIRIPSVSYLNELRALCDEKGWLLILDEIQSGNGRTGRYFAYQHNDILPDILTTAKGLGNGVPIGACLARGVAADILQPGNHGSTFGGNPLACASADAVLDTINTPAMLKRVDALSHHIVSGLQQQLSNAAGVKDIRGFGLMIAVELEEPCATLVEDAKQAGLLLNVTAGNVIRLLPPFILTDQEADTIVNTVTELVRSHLEQLKLESET